MILPINVMFPQPRRIERVCNELRAGRIIIYPTDTLYAFACSVNERRAINRLYQIKGDMRKRMSFICHDLHQVTDYAVVSDYAYKTMRRILPGPYTVILRATKLVPRMVLSKQNTVGIRIPDFSIATALAESLGHALLSTSVPAGEFDGLHDPVEIAERFGHLVSLVIDGGIIPTSPSTVLDMVEDYPVLLRAGKGPLDRLGNVIPMEEEES